LGSSDTAKASISSMRSVSHATISLSLPLFITNTQGLGELNKIGRSMPMRPKEKGFHFFQSQDGISLARRRAMMTCRLKSPDVPL
jgi:hypothetical protein